MGRVNSAISMKIPLLFIISVLITIYVDAGLDSSSNIDNNEIEALLQARGNLSSSNIDNTDEDFLLEANANLLKLHDPLFKSNANSSVHINKKKRLRAHDSYRGIITSQNFPNKYPDLVDKTYTIGYTSGDFLAIEFTDFDLESHRRCAYDWLMIRDQRGNELLPKTCGSSIPKTIYLQTRKLGFPVEVIFHSDLGVTRKGFRLEWKSDIATCKSGCCWVGPGACCVGSERFSEPYPEYQDSVEACAKRCANDPDCGAFDFHEGGPWELSKRCYLWKAASAVSAYTIPVNVNGIAGGYAVICKETCKHGCCWQGPGNYIVGGGGALWTNGETEDYDTVEACAKRCADLSDCKAFDYHNPGSFYGRRCYLWTAGQVYPLQSPG